MFRGQILSIHITAQEHAAMQSQESVKAVAGKGLEGDRYFLGSGSTSKRPDPGRQITLIEQEAILALSKEDQISLQPGETRRNLVTRGVPLNHLVGKEFQVGEVRLRGIRLCEPCKDLAAMTQPGVLPGLIHRGGLRAEILSSGTIRVGDVIAQD